MRGGGEASPAGEGREHGQRLTILENGVLGGLPAVHEQNIGKLCRDPQLVQDIPDRGAVLDLDDGPAVDGPGRQVLCQRGEQRNFNLHGYQPSLLNR
jgi:hypothetical protein